MSLKSGDFCLFRISVDATLATYLMPNESVASSLGSSSSSSSTSVLVSNTTLRIRRFKPKIRPCLIIGYTGAAPILLHVTSFNHQSLPSQYVHDYLPIHPNTNDGEVSVKTTPVWDTCDSWLYIRAGETVSVASIKNMGTPTKITPSSFISLQEKMATFHPPDVNEDQNERVRDGLLADTEPDVGTKQNEKQDSNKPEEHVHRNLEPLNEELDVSSDGGTDNYFGFNPLVDFWVGPKSLLNEILGNDLNGYDEITFEEELKELREIMLLA
ncbi:hypothetical protein HDU79_005638 [Rhizoclosmatium sp. JEL0117]|nr:hypothetical protein HDU79_005638 [Rhizoclosmatium sp. JEL0117]